VNRRRIQTQVFPSPVGLSEFTGLSARLFSVWCSLSGAMCFLLSFDLSNKSLFLVTYFSFFVALWFFITEHIKYKTVPLKGLWIQAFVASFSIYLMTLYVQSSGGFLVFFGSIFMKMLAS
jgi:hypothetical protein